jgi:hypothetical protein
MCSGIFAVWLVIPVWAIVDATSRPAGALAAAGSSKPMWIVLIVIGWFATGLIGNVLAVVYLASIRPRVRAVRMGAAANRRSGGQAVVSGSASWEPASRRTLSAPLWHPRC